MSQSQLQSARVNPISKTHRFQNQYLFMVLALVSLVKVGCAAIAEPTMPSRFDHATVTHLLDEVDRNQNEIILKIGYFDAHQAQALLVQEGYALVKAAADMEPTYTKRWFILQSVRAWAALRIDPQFSHEGLQTYASMFDHVGQAVQTNVANVLGRSIYEMVCAIPIDPHGLTSVYIDATSSKDILLKALAAHLFLVRQHQSYGLAPPWAQAIQSMGAGAIAGQMVDKAMADATMPKSYPLFMIAAASYHATEPEKAIEMLQLAKPLLTGERRDKVRSYYENLVDLLCTIGKLQKAVAMQQEFISLAGQGRAKLADLYYREKDEKSLNELLTALSVPNADESDMNDTAITLLKLDQTNKTNLNATTQVENLLRKYLSSPRSRDTEQELRARLTLARLLVAEQKREEAKTTLDIEHLQSRLSTPMARMRYMVALHMLQDLSK